MTLDTIYNEDCLQGMKQIPDGTIDAVICDLPYLSDYRRRTDLENELK